MATTTMTFTVASTNANRGNIKLTAANGQVREMNFEGAFWANDNRLRDPVMATIIDQFLLAGTTSGTVSVTTS